MRCPICHLQANFNPASVPATRSGISRPVRRDTRVLQAYLGHRNTQHAVRFTELAPDRFKHFWTD
jgi:hypothetical protein